MVSFGFSLCFLFFHLVVTIFVCLFVFSVVAVVISINYMPSTILGRGGRTVPNHAEWGDMRHKPSHLIRHMKNRDLKKKDETVALGIHVPRLYLPFCIVFRSVFQ